MNKVLSLLICLLAISSQSCKKDPTSHVSEITGTQGSIHVDVRTLINYSMVFYTGDIKDYPRTPVTVDLKVRDELGDSLVTIQTKITDESGTTKFDSLEQNTYYIYPNKDNEIGHVWIDSLDINDINLHDTVSVGVSYFLCLEQK